MNTMARGLKREGGLFSTGCQEVGTVLWLSIPTSLIVYKEHRLEKDEDIVSKKVGITHLMRDGGCLIFCGLLSDCCQ